MKIDCSRLLSSIDGAVAEIQHLITPSGTGDILGEATQCVLAVDMLKITQEKEGGIRRDGLGFLMTREDDISCCVTVCLEMDT